MPSTVTITFFRRWLSQFAGLVADNKQTLTDLDSAIGDGDHGVNMDRGMRAVTTAMDEYHGDSPSELLTKVGMTLVSSVGGASGPLFGTLFLRMGTALGPRPTVDLAEFTAALHAGMDGVLARGKAETGDKTMFDALAPAVTALEAASDDATDFPTALSLAAVAADAGRDATTAMLARKGRASYLGERSVGHQDPGATSAALLLTAAVRATS